MKLLRFCTPVILFCAATLVAEEKPPVLSAHMIRYPGASDTYLYGISNKNVAIGTYIDSNGNQHGFTVTDGGKFTTIDNPNGTTYLEAMNSSGTIVGYYIDSSNNYFAFTYSNGVFTNIGPPGGSQTLAFGINDDGVISGEYMDPSTGLDEGFLFNGSTYETVLSPQSGEPALAFDTNVNGITTVQWEDVNGYVESSLYNGSTYKTADVPGAANSYIHGIDSAGDTVYSYQYTTGGFHGAAQVGGRFFTFNVPGCTGGTYGNGINDNHIIVGVCIGANNVGSGFYTHY